RPLFRHAECSRGTGVPWYDTDPSAGPDATRAERRLGIASGPLNNRVETMKLTIERAALLKALSHVQSVVERRTTIPILSNVLLRAEAGRLALSATDMDLEIVEGVPARVERDGRTTAPAHTLYAIVRKLRDGAQVELEAPGGRNEMLLRSGRSTFTLACLPPEDYPVMSAGELPHHFALSAAELPSLIHRTRAP